MHTITLTVNIPDYCAEAFSRAMTGNDQDIILAAERAMNERLSLPEPSDHAKVEIECADELRPA